MIDPLFDLRDTPFSRFGAYLAFSLRPDETNTDALFLRTVHGDSRHDKVFRVDVLVGGQSVPFICAADAACLRLQTQQETDGTACLDICFVDICFAAPDTVRFRAQGCGLRLSLVHVGAYGFAQPVGEGVWHVNSFENRRSFRLRVLHGMMTLDAPMAVARCERIVADFLPEGGTAEGEITEFRVSPPLPSGMTFDDAHDAIQQEWDTWHRPNADRAQQVADYICWASVVAPEGHFTRPAMLMSKNWMTNVWSWDHCFNAMALTRRHPALAWDQFCIPFDGQDVSGALPDCMNDALRIWNFTKPPIHGWTLRWMLERTEFITPVLLTDIYPRLCAWTRWWLRERDDDRDGLPHYNHGNDSGWDNATAFDVGFPVEGPDLCAFLIVQMDTLADVAARLGKTQEATQWTQEADALLLRLREHFWRDAQFVAPRSGTHETSGGDSLLLLLPLVLGPRLPDDMAEPLLTALREPDRFVTEYGVATEAVSSPLYVPDGYWRGPVWGPPVLLLVDGLTRRGEQELASQIASGFCRAFEQSGSAENFNALTGAGLRDRAYTWTASVFSVLRDEKEDRV